MFRNLRKKTIVSIGKNGQKLSCINFVFALDSLISPILQTILKKELHI